MDAGEVVESNSGKSSLVGGIGLNVATGLYNLCSEEDFPVAPNRTIIVRLTPKQKRL